MKTKIIISLCVLLIGGIKSNAQFNKGYGSASGGSVSDGRTTDILATSDGGYIGITTYITSANGSGDISVVKVNASGVISWQKSYGTTADSELPYTIAQLNDGGYIIGAYTQNPPVTGDYDALYLKINSSGTLQWAKKYGTTSAGENLYSIQGTNDGGFVGTNSASFNSNVTVIKVNSSGTLDWNKGYNFGVTSGGNWIDATTDGGYMVAGTINQDGLLLKITSSGSVSWANKYVGAGSESLYSVQQTADGGYIAAGHTGTDGLIVKTTSSGALSWGKTCSSNSFVGNISQTADGGYMVPSSNKLFKLTNTGTLSWGKSYSPNSSIGKVYEVSAGGYMFSGTENFFGTGTPTNYALYLGKTDANGVNCVSASTSPTINSTTPTVTSVTAGINGPFTLSSVTLSTTNLSLTENSSCCTANAGPDKVTTHGSCCPVGPCPATQIGTANTGYTYSWATCDATLSSCVVAQPNASPCSTTSYTLTVSGTGCTSNSDVMTVTVNTCCQSGRPERMIGKGNIIGISIFPNPTNGELTIESENEIQSVTIIDLTGRTVFTDNSGATHKNIDLSKEPKGIYLVKIMQNGKEKIEKISLE